MRGMRSGVMEANCIDLRVKVVPGAKTDEIAGWLGDRLKVRVTAPPENGRANRAVAELLREVLNAGSAEVIAGHGSRQKTVRLTDCDAATLEKLGR